MASNGITNDHFSKIIFGISSRKSRISIDLKNNIIGNGIEVLGHFLLKPNFLLDHIHLQGNSLTNTALVSLAWNLKESKSPIRNINLSKNNITLSTGSLLIQCSLSNPHCNVKINLDGNPECSS